jgi:hypothetical protein
MRCLVNVCGTLLVYYLENVSMNPGFRFDSHHLFCNLPSGFTTHIAQGFYINSLITDGAYTHRVFSCFVAA